MPTIYDLPIDVIHRVFYFSTKLATESLVEWGRALPLLKVCQSWREVGVRTLYNIAFIQDSYSYIHNTQGSAAAKYLSNRLFGKVHTNINLIQQNGFLLNVHILNICTIGDVSVNAFSLLYALSFASVANISHSVVKKLQLAELSQPEDEFISSAEYNQLSEICLAYAQNIANGISNVNAVDIVIGQTGVFIKCFIECLVGQYSRQLSSFDYSGPIFFDNCPTFTCLTDLSICTEDFDGRRLPPVCAETLRRVDIYAEFNTFKWEMLNIDSNSDTVVFKSLESLSITSVYENPEEHIQPQLYSTNLQQKKLSFPLLKNLTLNRVSLRNEEIQSLLQSPLKTLYFCGCTSQALDICKQNLNSLDNITLRIDNDSSTSVFTNNMNKILTRTHGIRMVECIITLPVDNDLSNIFWPNLTHLELNIESDFANIIKAIPRMPDLVNMKLSIFCMSSSHLNLAFEFLENLKQYYPEPSSSSLQVLKVGGISEKRKQRFVPALEGLKWYFPNLKTIEVV